MYLRRHEKEIFHVSISYSPPCNIWSYNARAYSPIHFVPLSYVSRERIRISNEFCHIMTLSGKLILLQYWRDSCWIGFRKCPSGYMKTLSTFNSAKHWVKMIVFAKLLVCVSNKIEFRSLFKQKTSCDVPYRAQRMYKFQSSSTFIKRALATVSECRDEKFCG